MGDDACLSIRVKKPLLPDEIRKLSWRLAGAFYREPFFFFDENDLCLEENKEDSTIIEVRLSSRWYGPEYERGDLPTILMVAEWLEYNVSGCMVLYGNDSDDRTEVFDAAKRQVYKEHFFQHGHFPYVSYRGPWKDGKHQPICPRCREKMNDVGGGGGETFWSCYGCPNKMITSTTRSDTMLFTNGEFFTKVTEFRNTKCVES